MRLPAFTIITIVAVIGCGSHFGKKKKHPPASLPSSAPAPVVERAVGSFRPPPAPVLPVKQESPPLAYIVEGGGSNGVAIRVAEKQTGMTLVTAVVKPGSIVSVDERAGV